MPRLQVAHRMPSPWVFAVLLLALGIGLVGCASVAGPDLNSDKVERGRWVAESYCARCHAVGMDDQGLDLRARPLRELPERRNLLSLRQHLRLNPYPQPPEMARLDLSDSDIEALFEYLDTLHP